MKVALHVAFVETAQDSSGGGKQGTPEGGSRHGPRQHLSLLVSFPRFARQGQNALPRRRSQLEFRDIVQGIEGAGATNFVQNFLFQLINEFRLLECRLWNEIR